MGQKKDLSQISTGFEEWLSCFPLQGKKLFSLVHLKLPKDREVPISDKCYCNTDAQRTWTFKLWRSDLDCWPLLGLSGVSKEYWVLQIAPEGVNLLNPNLFSFMWTCCILGESDDRMNPDWWLSQHVNFLNFSGRLKLATAAHTSVVMLENWEFCNLLSFSFYTTN